MSLAEIIISMCVTSNNRVQILTEELKYHSMLGIGMNLFTHPRDIKVTRDRVLVLDGSDPCMFIFNSEHLLINRIITRGRGRGKQTNDSHSFDIDRDYNIIMSDYSNDCVYVFNKEGEQIHKFGNQGQCIGEFYYPFYDTSFNQNRERHSCTGNKSPRQDNHCTMSEPADQCISGEAITPCICSFTHDGGYMIWCDSCSV